MIIFKSHVHTCHGVFKKFERAGYIHSSPKCCCTNLQETEKISLRTKETFRQPPFSLINCIDWTEQPTKAGPLKHIFTAPSYSRKYRKAQGLKKERPDDIFEIFMKEQLNTGYPARILLQGNVHNILKIHSVLSKLLS